MSSNLKDFTLDPIRGAHPIINLIRLLGSDHILYGGPDDNVFIFNVSEEDLKAACELAEIPLPRELKNK